MTTTTTTAEETAGLARTGASGRGRQKAGQGLNHATYTLHIIMFRCSPRRCIRYANFDVALRFIAERFVRLRCVSVRCVRCDAFHCAALRFVTLRSIAERWLYSIPRITPRLITNLSPQPQHHNHDLDGEATRTSTSPPSATRPRAGTTPTTETRATGTTITAYATTAPRSPRVAAIGCRKQSQYSPWTPQTCSRFYAPRSPRSAVWCSATFGVTKTGLISCFRSTRYISKTEITSSWRRRSGQRTRPPTTSSRPISRTSTAAGRTT
jgi:hypothetical protein